MMNWMIPIGLAPHGAQRKEDGNMRFPLFRLPATSTTITTTTVTVFAQPGSQADRVSAKLKSVKIQVNA